MGRAPFGRDLQAAYSSGPAVKLVSMIDYWAKHKPEQLAVVMLDTAITYGSLSRAIRSVAGHLSLKKLDPSAPVGILVDQPAHNVVVNCALMLLGIPSIVVREAQVQYLSKIGAKTLIYTGQTPAAPGLSFLPVDLAWFGDTNPRQPARIGTATRTKLAFTSGTTGIPKAISFSDDDIAVRSNLLRAVTGDVQWTRSLIVPGLSTNFGFSQVALALEVGRTISFAASAEDICRTIDLFGIELMICSNQQAQSVVDYLQSAKRRLRGLKCIWIGGAVPTEALLAKVGEYVCRDAICVYASTEAHVAAFARWDTIKHVPRAVGFLCPWATVECVDEQGKVLPAGREGNIRLKTPNQGLQFPTIQEEDDQLETWFYPGDRGFVNPEGILVIQGRAIDTINKGGVKVSASVIEDCLRAMSGIEDAAVCGIANEGLGFDEIVALVIARNDVSPDVLNAALARASSDATIDRVIRVAKIPRNETGKVNREEIKTLAQQWLRK
jgi:long-chain acyl-CoA synthetase